MNNTRTQMCRARIIPEKLRDWAIRILTSVGCDESSAQATAQMLVEADVYGLQSHGVGIMLPIYVGWIEEGRINTGSDIAVVEETATTAVLDGRNNLGPVIAHKAMGILTSKARQNNVAWVSVRHSNHIGFLGYWARKIVDQEMIGIVMSNSGPDMAIHGGIGRNIGTNPISIGAPASPYPLVLDIASSAVAAGKLRQAALHGQSVPPTWGMDVRGKPTTDPERIIDGGAVLPMAGHKGSGLSVMIDVFCGLLAGANYSTLISDALSSGEPLNMGHFFGAIRIESFCELGVFCRRMTEFIETLHALPRLPGVDRIYLPGEIEFETAQKRRKDGIPISADTKKVLDQMARKYDCPLPASA